MKKKKLSLKALQVESFVTSFNGEKKNAVKGGFYDICSRVEHCVDHPPEWCDDNASAVC